MSGVFGSGIELIVGSIGSRKRHNRERLARMAAARPARPPATVRKGPRAKYPGVALIETRRPVKTKRLLRVGSLLLGIHATLIAVVIYSQRGIASADAASRMRVDTTMVFLDQRPNTPHPEPVRVDVPLQGFKTIAVSMDIPTDIPPIDLNETFDPRDYTGIGVEGGRANGIVPTSDQVFAEAAVDERPALLSPPPDYPRSLEQAGIEGRVRFEAIIDTTGRIDSTSIRIVETTHAGFAEHTKRWALQARFRPGRIRGRVVRVLVSLPIVYRAQRNGHLRF